MRRSRTWMAFTAGLLVLLALAFVVSRNFPGRQGAPAASPPAASLKALPALPEDIEAHGEQSKSVLDPDDARARNAAVPFSAGPLSVARPFAFRGSDMDRTRALDCLATAVLYEAGDDSVGEAAVAQVVLNRVRHPAFPATVCGVVYQGSQRATGCQFTFTCDGSLARRAPDAAWRRAREVADRALAGWVDKSVGLATHYHTDWVYPYWSPELRKLARVGTHLFFGWPGSWGGPRGFTQQYRGNEANLAAMAGGGTDSDKLLPGGEGAPHILGLPQPPVKLPAGMGSVPLYGNRVRLVSADGRGFGLLAQPGAHATTLVNAALALCSKPGPCHVSAWQNEDDIPGEYPIPAGARGTMIFDYVRDGAGGAGTLRFDCSKFPNRDPKRCLAAPKGDDLGLSGVRWKSD